MRLYDGMSAVLFKIAGSDRQDNNSHDQYHHSKTNISIAFKLCIVFKRKSGYQTLSAGIEKSIEVCVESANRIVMISYFAFKSAECPQSKYCSEAE